MRWPWSSTVKTTSADSLTLEQLARLFSTADTWLGCQRGLARRAIERFIPGTDSGTFDYFVEEVFNKDQAPILDAARTSLSEDDNVLVNGVSATPTPWASSVTLISRSTGTY